MVRFENRDCLELLRELPDGSIDLMLQDPPYGVTQNEWDKEPNLPVMWAEWERVIKDNGAMLFFAQPPFSASLILSRAGFYKYTIYWDKIRPKNHLNAKKQPMRCIEEIIVFYKQQPTYNPQFKKKRKQDIRDNGKTYYIENNGNYGETKSSYVLNEFRDIDVDTSYPDNLVSIPGVGSFGFEKTGHPTQKPEDLICWLIRTFTNKGDVVFDGYSGSGTTAVCCIKEGRKFIGCELNADYYSIAANRIKEESSKLVLF